MYMYMYMLQSCLSSSVGRVLCLEYRVSWVRVTPEVAHLKVTALGVLCCFASFVCLTLLLSFISHLKTCIVNQERMIKREEEERVTSTHSCTYGLNIYCVPSIDTFGTERVRY